MLVRPHGQTEILLLHPEYLPQLSRREWLALLKTGDQFYAEAVQSFQAAESWTARLDALRRYQRSELLRIGACDLLNLFDLPAVVPLMSSESRV